MRTFIWASFITTFLFIMILSASAAIDPNMILYFAFDEKLEGRKVEDLTVGGTMGNSNWVPRLLMCPRRFTRVQERSNSLTSVLRSVSSPLRE